MDLDDVLKRLNDAGLAFQWRREPNVGGRAAILRPKNGKSINLGGLEVGVVIPDVHLGVGNDIFRTVDLGATNAKRLKLFLDVLAGLRDEVSADKFRVLQLGDWYDFFRAPGETIEDQVDSIEAQYQDICAAARKLPVLHCIGNHDGALFAEPDATRSQFGITQFLGSPRIVAYHGVNYRTLQSIRSENLGEVIGLNLVNLLAMLPILGNIVDFIQMVIDDSFEDPSLLGNHSGDKPWQKARGAAPDAWDAPWVSRSDTNELIQAARGIEYVTDTAIEIAFVGHSHRPGISSGWITDEHEAVLVDVGSWTYGRAEIAIVTPDGVGLAEIPVG